MDFQRIGQRIRAIRKQKKLPQEKLAEAVGVGTSHISHIENGHTKMSIQTFVSICNALQISADELLCGQVYQAKAPLTDEAALLLADCGSKELSVLVELIKQTKASLRTVYKEG